MAVYPLDITKQTILEKALSLSTEKKLLMIIVASLATWFVTACFMWMLYPDATLSIKGNLSTFMRFGSRNSIGFLVLFGYIAITVFLFKVLQNMKVQPPITYIKGTVTKHKSDILKAPWLLALGIITFCVFLCSYSMIKTRIPELVPYKWDNLFARMDQFIFFGKDPWLYFAWVYDMPELLRNLDKIYNIWAGLFAGSWVCAFIGTSETVRRRFKYVIAVMLTWFIGGNVLATLLSSAGPCYYGLVAAQPDIFAPQMQLLNNIGDLHFVEYQKILWDVYQSPSSGVGGISAMPSMHCATSFLFILMYGRTPIMRVITIAFFLTILCSSVILAWHYAVDGLLGMLVAYLCWKLAGRITTAVK